MADCLVGGRGRHVVGLSLVVLLAACGGEVTTGTDDENGVEREGFAVTVRVAEEDMEAADRLGWTDGRVPGLEVILARETVEGTIADSALATTDAAGRAEFGELLPAVYRVTALRLLEPAEVAAVEGAFPTLRAFGGGDKVQVAPALPAEFELELQGNRTGGLVISEWSFTTTVLGQEGFGYVFGGYLEVYNNSEQTLFLDGTSVAFGYDSPKDFACCPCTATRAAANDPEGVWAHWFQRFPGSGAESPLGPGETAVVATDARDHRQVAEVFLDLRDADFEFTGSSDVDNPDVPNMVDNGLSEWFHGHGLWSNGGGEVPTLLGDLDIESLPREPIRLTNDRPWVRFPAAEILDVYSVDFESFNGTAFCSEMVNDRFDRLDLVLPQDFSEPPGPRMSQQRRVVGTALGGWPILLDTNTSAVDFVTTERTAGSLPPRG